MSNSLNRAVARTLPLAGASAAAIFAASALLGMPRIVFEAPNDLGAAVAEMKTLAVDLKKATDEVKKHAETSNTEIKNLGKVTDETKEKADKALLDMNGIAGRLDDVEKKMAAGLARGGDRPEVKSLGERVTDSDGFKSVAELGDRFSGKVRIEVKNITSASATGTSAGTALQATDRQALVTLPNRQLRVRDLVMPGRTDKGIIEYPRETVFTNAAAFVAENPSSPKPQSDITYAMVSVSAKTLAHFIMASKQILADAPQLQSQIDGRLRYGLAYVEDNGLLNGDGTGQNLTGMNTVATAYAAPTGVTIAAPTMIDKLRLAMLQATLALYPASGHVLNPIDWANIELSKDTQGRYIFANPTGLAGPTLWGLPVVETMAQPVGYFLTGAFKMAAQIFDREDADVLISTEDRDNFVKNMVTILAEERLALAIYRPQALIKGPFSNT